MFDKNISGIMPIPAVTASFSTVQNDSVKNHPSKSEGSELCSGEKDGGEAGLSTIRRATSLKMKLDEGKQGRVGEGPLSLCGR